MASYATMLASDWWSDYSCVRAGSFRQGLRGVIHCRALFGI